MEQSPAEDACRNLKEQEQCIEGSRQIANAVKSSANEHTGQTVIEAKVLGRTRRVLLDTRSQISIIPLKMLIKARDDGYDLNSNVEEVLLTSSKPICDASGNQMQFKGAVKVAASLGKTAPQMIVMFVQETEDDTLVFGRLYRSSGSMHEPIHRFCQIWLES
ncbi:hypothetical protein OESDEN_13549 [Oesophagostomum dentatum]|uniref:Peptidase A2 domain-containing protein n=1 Tax=Oesophagostomum dentatum TaxID=61180 RepID=A0A0B1ST64_OESDE|nr:hypothetical protein OESDEN_13549 [Oesophagostomum dentatum]